MRVPIFSGEGGISEAKLWSNIPEKMKIGGIFSYLTREMKKGVGGIFSDLTQEMKKGASF
jgi:hypothetical protein